MKHIKIALILLIGSSITLGMEKEKSQSKPSFIQKIMPSWLQKKLPTYFELLPSDVRLKIILPYLASSDVAAAANYIRLLNITNAETMLTILKSLPRTTIATQIANELKDMPIMKDKTIKKWLEDAQQRVANVHKLSEKLIDAASRADDETIKKMLQSDSKDLNLDQPNNAGWTALMFASRRNNAPLVELLLKAGANPNIVTTSNGWTVLMVAAETGRTAIVKLLLDAGANPDIQSRQKPSPLTFAAAGNYKEIVQMLLDANANPNLQDNTGMTALMYAADKGHTDIVKILLAKGADSELKTKDDNKTAADFAREEKHMDIVDLLTAKKN